VVNKCSPCLNSRIARLTFAVGLVTVTAHGAAMIVPGPGLPMNGQTVNGVTNANGFLSQTIRLPQCQLTATTTASPCSDTAFVSTQIGTATSNFLNMGFNGVPPPQAYPVTPGGPASALLQAIANSRANNALGGLSTMVSNVQLPINITITTFQAVAPVPNMVTLGGMAIRAAASYNAAVPVGAPAINQLAWLQIVYDNYFPATNGFPAATPQMPGTAVDSYKSIGGTGGNPPPSISNANSLNQACMALPVAPANGFATFPMNPGSTMYELLGVTKTVPNAYCDPIYPFQSNTATTANFSDGPSGPWRVPASFRAIDFLTAIQNVRGTQTLVIYNDAVLYGFNLAIPEPGFQALLACMGIILIVAAARRRAVKGASR
jgi:hypothetical protein